MSVRREVLALAFGVAFVTLGCNVGAGPRNSSRMSSPGDTVASSGVAPGSTPDSTNGHAFDVTTYRGNPARTGAMPGPPPHGIPGVIWTFQAAAALESSPAVVGERVILASKDGVIHALDLATGAQRWSAWLGAQLGAASPLVIDGLIVLGDRTGVVHALDLASGVTVWTRATDGPIDGSAAGLGDEVFTATEAGTAFALDARSGTVVWQARLGGGVSRSIAARDDTIYLGFSGGGFAAIAIADGTLRWETRLGTAGEGGTATVVDGMLYEATGLDSGDPHAMTVLAIDASTGAVRWRYASPKGRPVYTPAVVDGRAFVVSEDSSVVALDATTGAELWSLPTDAPVEALPAVAGGMVIVATDGRVLEAVDAATGAVAWEASISGVPYAPIVAHGTVLVATSTGTLFALADRQR
jgi:eukaryotic-like serine/threonine-protein kinase